MKEENPKGYTLLWTLVVIMSVVILAPLLLFDMGHGRWECIEEINYEIKTCDVIYPKSIPEGKGSGISTLDCEIEYKTECIKEAWIRHPND